MRKFLVVLDDSRECLNAMRFAAMRAAKTGGGVERTDRGAFRGFREMDA